MSRTPFIRHLGHSSCVNMDKQISAVYPATTIICKGIFSCTHFLLSSQRISNVGVETLAISNFYLALEVSIVANRHLKTSKARRCLKDPQRILCIMESNAWSLGRAHFRIESLQHRQQRHKIILHTPSVQLINGVWLKATITNRIYSSLGKPAMLSIIGMMFVTRLPI